MSAPDHIDPPAEDDNAAGWALLSKPGRGAADLEAAVALFRQSIQRAPERPQAVANLANSLVELGREAEAIDELTRLASAGRDVTLAGTAHNWLGLRLSERDPAGATDHLHNAVRLRPAWGVAWLNLARALDAAGEIAAACTAYSEAIVRGNAHDDAFARDRRLQLEMQLLLRNEPVPPVPETARADSVAFAIVRATAAARPTAHAFMIRPTTRSESCALIGTVACGRALGHTIVSAAADWLSAITLARDGDTIAFEAIRGGATAVQAAAPLAAWLAALDSAALTPLDAAVYLRDSVVGKLPGNWTWQLAGYRPAAMAVVDSAGQLRITATARPGGGIDIALPPLGLGQPSEALTAATPADLLALAPAIADATQRAITARDAFAQRRFGIRHAVAQLTRALGLGESSINERYPAPPYASIYDANNRFTALQLAESPGELTITLHRDRFTAHSADELTALLPAIAAAVTADLARPHIHRLAPGDCFRVIAAFGPFAPGSDIRFHGASVVSREAEQAYTFTGLHGSARFVLNELDEADVAILAELDRYLASTASLPTQ